MITSSTLGPLPDAPLLAADLNNDGYPDLATGFGFVFTNNHGSGFAETAELGTSDGMLAFAFGDLNGDGCLDVAATGAYGFLTLGQGNCDGTSATARSPARSETLRSPLTWST